VGGLGGVLGGEEKGKRRKVWRSRGGRRRSFPGPYFTVNSTSEALRGGSRRGEKSKGFWRKKDRAVGGSVKKGDHPSRSGSAEYQKGKEPLLDA